MLVDLIFHTLNYVIRIFPQVPSYLTDMDFSVLDPYAGQMTTLNEYLAINYIIVLTVLTFSFELSVAVINFVRWLITKIPVFGGSVQ